MPSKKRVDCVITGLEQEMVNDGHVPDDEITLQRIGNDPHMVASAAGIGLRNDKLITMDVSLDDTSTLVKGARFFEDYLKIPAVDALFGANTTADVLGRGVTDTVSNVFKEFQQKFPRGTLKDWRRVTKNLWNELEGQTSAANPDFKQKYIKTYFTEQREGGVLFGSERNESAFTKISNNVVRNFVSNNVAISAGNVIEIAPKGFAYATVLGNPMAFVRALTKTFKDTGGKVTQRVPALEAANVYGKRDLLEHSKLTETLKLGGVVTAVRGVQKKIGLDSILDPTENFLRTTYHNLGEEIHGVGGGVKALEDLAFVYDHGNMPQFLWRTSGDKNAMSLMRFATGSLIFSSKLVRGLFVGIQKGDKEMMGRFGQSLLAFGVAQTVQTGISSTLPWPVTFIPEEIREEYGFSDLQLEELDRGLPFNLAGKLTGQDYGEFVRPFGFPALGIGFALATNDVNAIKRGFGKTLQGMTEGDIIKAATGFAAVGLYAAQLGSVPGVNYTNTKIVEELSKAAINEYDFSTTGLNILTRLKLHSPPPSERPSNQ